MTLNPVLLLFLLYSSANSYAFYLLLKNGGFIAFDRFFLIDSVVSVSAFLIQIFLLLFFLVLYRFFAQGGRPRLELKNGYGYFLLFLTAAFLCFNQVTGAGRAGSGFSFGGESILNIIFILLQPDLLFFLIAPFLRSSRLFNVISFAFLISMLSRGWMGSVLLLLIVYLVRFYPVRITVRSFFYLAFLGFFVVIALPFLDGIKWGMRSGISLFEVYSQVLSKNYFEIIGVVLDSVISRFQNINYAAYALQNSDFFHYSLLQGDFLWFYQGGIINSVYCKLNSCVVDLNIFSAETLYGETGLAWNIDPGLTGWISFLYGYVIFFFLFMILLLLLSYRAFSKFYGFQGSLLLGCFVYMYFFHGWLGAFYNFVLYGLFFCLFFRVKAFKGVHDL
ncbi:oligosaccharide repeat unit polymerase [Aeromonas veronii]|uniref:oligosaccharide repeat unit polymerase n=1 Tax=Aeromonas veronii TaxID=654 RepID=UPI00191DD1B0|nr:oligosaccharide repeat unit polymerase [Aeromonas veronii]MBL0446257.1 oligosaccharide repeat unit polymerase [Aeromonas veronii]